MICLKILLPGNRLSLSTTFLKMNSYNQSECSRSTFLIFRCDLLAFSAVYCDKRTLEEIVNVRRKLTMFLLRRKLESSIENVNTGLLNVNNVRFLDYFQCVSGLLRVN